MAKKEPSTSEAPERFEDRVARLESLIDRIESGEIGLDASIEAYEQGIEIIESCRAMLATAEQRVQELTTRLTDSEHDGGA